MSAVFHSVYIVLAQSKYSLNRMMSCRERRRNGSFMIFLNQRQCPVNSSESSLVVNETKVVPDLLQKTNLNEVFKMLSDRTDEILKAKSHSAGVVTLKKCMHHHAAMGKSLFGPVCFMWCFNYAAWLLSQTGFKAWHCSLGFGVDRQRREDMFPSSCSNEHVQKQKE